MREIIKFSIVLLSITLMSALFLALIYDITEPRIEEQRRLEEERAIEEVLPRIPATIEKIEDQDLVFYKAKDEDGSLIAYVFVARSYGYSSDINTVVSLTPDGKIIAVKILEQRETPGIGSQISESDFLEQFNNQDINKQFDTITGATISSEAVIDSIKKKASEVLKYEQ